MFLFPNAQALYQHLPGNFRISAHLTTQSYWRLRIGIGHPRDARPDGAKAPSERPDVANFVLKAPRREEQALIDASLNRAMQVMQAVVKDDFEHAMRCLHKSCLTLFRIIKR
jgi:PTH1 family peptidyl-tRNA hydrolase